MATELAALEQCLTPLRPAFGKLLVSTGVSPDRLIRTVLISCERNPKLLECTLPSILQGATSFAVLALEVDGFTGQAHLVPFRDKGVLKAQPIVGTRGYNTIGARTGLTITGTVVREGDLFDFDEGEGWVKHRKAGGAGRPITWAWAKAAARDRPPAVSVLHLDEIMDVMKRSPAVRAGQQTPWKDAEIGFPAMAEKTARRRLARSLPLSAYQRAARMDEAHEEQGLHSHLDLEGSVIIDGIVQPLVTAQPAPNKPPLQQIEEGGFVIKAMVQGKEELRRFPTIEQWRARMLAIIEPMPPERAMQFEDRNSQFLVDYGHDHPDHVRAVSEAFAAKRGML